MAKIKFKDDEFRIIHSDVLKIQAAPSSYIGSLGESGIFHLCKELIDNASDEALKKDSPCDEFVVEMNDKQLRVYDNGRGIPIDLVQEVFETLQAGSNMLKSGGFTRGVHGAGSSCVTAMSSYLKLVSTRPTENKRLTLIYEDARLKDRILEEYNGTDHGFDVTFRPSKLVMGDDKIPVHLVLDWLKDLDYTLPSGIKVTYKANGTTYHVHHKKLKDYFSEMIPQEQHLSNILTTLCSGKLDEVILGKTYHRRFNVEFALMYTDPKSYRDDDIRQSWMNMIYNPNNGDHVDGVIRGFTKFITEECVRRNKRLSGQDLRKDVLAHLQVVVRAEADMARMFDAQAKHHVLSKDLGKAIENSVYHELSNNNYSAIPSIVEAIIGNHRARIEGEKARNVASATRVKKKWSDPESYIPCASIKTDMPKELFMVEGKSAGGGLDGARDARYQAIIKFRGKSQNVYDVDINDAVNTDSWKDLIPVLECGVGPTFDIRKLKFDKIIIATDADIDGFHIRTIICTFFKKFLPEIIDAGKLYIAEPPLYQLVNGKDVSYVATQTEYIEKCIKSIGDLRISFTDTKVSNVSVQDFVRDAFDYLNTLKECSIDHSVNRYLLEHIAHGIAMYNGIDGFIKNVDKWIRSLVKIYPELGFNHDTNQVTATIDLVDQLVIIDDELCDSLMSIIDIIRRYGFLIHYTSEKRGLDKTTPVSGFFEYIEDLYPVIKSRFKGLGSSDPSVMREVVMDPRTRRLIRVTANDVSTWQKMGILVGEGKENVRQRKEMLMNFKFTKADIDN